MHGQPPTFQYDPAMSPDSQFEPGELHHLVVGNRARLLDDRRTPVRRRDPTGTVALFRQPVPLHRLFMSYFETPALNHPIRETEAVLIADPANLAF